MKRIGSSPFESPYPKLPCYENSLEIIIPGLNNDVIPIIMKKMRWKDINSCLLTSKKWLELTQKSFHILNEKNQRILKIIEKIQQVIFPQHFFSPKNSLETNLCSQLQRTENFKNRKLFTIKQQIETEEICHSIIQSALKFLQNQNRNIHPIMSLTGVAFSLDSQEEDEPQLIQYLIKTEQWEILFAFIEKGECNKKKGQIENKFLNYKYVFQQILILKNEEMASDLIGNILSKERQEQTHQAFLSQGVA